MSCTPRTLSRPVRRILLLACAAGVVASGALFPTLAPIASDDWWTPVAASSEASIASNADGAMPPIQIRSGAAARLSMTTLRNGLLYSAGPNAWRLDLPKADFSTAWLTAEPVAIPGEAGGNVWPNDLLRQGLTTTAARETSSVPLGPDGAPTGIWISNASGNWGTPGNWQGGSVPSGSNVAAHFDSISITTDVTVTVETARTIGDVYLGDSNGSNHYTIAPGAGATSLTFNNAGASSVLNQSSTSAGDTVSVPIFIKNDLVITNGSTTKALSITGNIASSATNATAQTLYFTSGLINVSGDISNGITGATVGLSIGHAVVNLSGTNTYTGGTFVQGGTLFVKGDNSGATGFVQVAGAGSILSGIGTVGGPVTMFGGTITAGDTTTVGKLTLTQSLNISSSEGGGGIYLANLDSDLSDLLAIGGNLQIGSGTTLNIQGTADGTTTYILATFASHIGTFDNVLGLPTNYSLVYSGTDLELVPTAIPEAATWIGGALGVAALGWARRRRQRRR